MRVVEWLARLCVLALATAAGPACRDSNASGSPAPGASTQNAGVPVEAELTLPGVDTSALTPRERRQWSTLVGQLLAPCPSVPVPVAQCVREARACPACRQAASWMSRAVREGLSDEQIHRAYKQRFDPAGVKALPVDGSPTQGPDDAAVTVVEFADFECPHCREAVPLVDAVLAAHKDKVRFIYKSFTLSFHTHGEPAARAAFAAGLQGKFWEMEHLLFEHQEQLEATDLDRYSRMLKIDLTKWKADMDSGVVRERLAHDHALGEQLGLKGTPTIYVNGRELDIERDESLEARVAAELGDPLPSARPATSASAAGPPPSGSLGDAAAALAR